MYIYIVIYNYNINNENNENNGKPNGSLMPWVAADWVQRRSSGSVFALGTTASSKFEKCQGAGPGSMEDKGTKGRVEEKEEKTKNTGKMHPPL
jgi:hypothetical protein